MCTIDVRIYYFPKIALGNSMSSGWDKIFGLGDLEIVNGAKIVGSRIVVVVDKESGIWSR